METTHAAGHRTLPPAPRVLPPVPRSSREQDSYQDAGQRFVARLRTAAATFAAAAGADTAVVREAVPPARHRRSRCRVVLRYPGGQESDLTFLGPPGRPDASAAVGLDTGITRWLATGQRREPAWLVPDRDAADGVAVDVGVWLSAR